MYAIPQVDRFSRASIVCFRGIMLLFIYAPNELYT